MKSGLGEQMHAKRTGKLGAIAATGSLLLLGGCTSDDLAMFADAMAVAADDMAVTMTMVPAWGCDYNVNYDLVCDDTGDGFADRYADPYYDYTGPAYYTPVEPPVRVNGRGKAYQYDGACDCWLREPSLDEAPPGRDHDHGRHHDDWDD